MEKEIIIEVPEGTQVEVKDKKVTLTKNGKTLSKQFRATQIELSKEEGNKIKIYSPKVNRKVNATMNTFKSHLNNLIQGLDREFVYKMEIVYSHFPMTVTVKGKTVEINNLAGAKNTRIAKIIGDTKVEVKGKNVIVTGNHLEDTGQTAANIEKATRIRGKDIRIFQDGVYIIEKPKKQVIA